MVTELCYEQFEKMRVSKSMSQIRYNLAAIGDTLVSYLHMGEMMNDGYYNKYYKKYYNLDIITDNSTVRITTVRKIMMVWSHTSMWGR